jgi:hypothetical protein
MRTHKIVLNLIPAIALALVSSSSARAGGLVQNGSFEDFTGGQDGDPSQLASSRGSGTGYTTLTDWTVGTGTYGFLMGPGTADTTGSYSPQYSNTFTLWGTNTGGPSTIPATSPDGGNFLAMDGGASYRGDGISQTLTGLTSGDTYSVSFYWAGGQQSGFHGNTTEAMQVSFGGSSQTTPTYTNTAVNEGGSIGLAGQFSGWMQQTFTFKADGSSDVLNFLAIGTPDSLPPIVLLDGVSVTAVPEPASISLLAVSMIGLGAVYLRRRRNSASA